METLTLKKFFAWMQKSTFAPLVVIPMGAIYMAVLFAIVPTVKYEDSHRWISEPEKWAEFERCVDDHPSDAVCDSCYLLIFGQ